MSDENKTWTVVGTSIKKGEKTLRFANGTAAAREKVLLKDNHSEVRLFDLPSAMTKEAAVAWLEAQGDTVPVRAPKAAVAPRSTREKPAIVLPLAVGPLQHEELGRVRYANSTYRVLKWDEMDLTTKQEMCRNAAWAAGIATPRGTYPQLDAFLAADGVDTLEDGSLKCRVTGKVTPGPVVEQEEIAA